MLTQIFLLQTAAILISCVAASTLVTVQGTPSHDIPPLLYGLMFEDINSGDGGLYAELLQNRAFQAVTPNTAAALQAWSAINGATITVVADNAPVSSALPNSLQLTVPKGASGQVGFANEGYGGIKVVADWTYAVSFYYKFPAGSSFNGAATVTLQSATGQVYASASVPITGSTAWKQVSVSLKPTSSPASTANKFTVTFDGPRVASQTINFAMFSLFPPTFKGRANGLRIDIATALNDIKPSFFRMPGGNNLGESIASRWKWDATVGQIVNRPGRMGDWGYPNTDGLGLLEFLYMCEDMEMEPIMAVWAGYALGGHSVAEKDLDQYIQTAIDQIYFAIGDPAKNKFAALRSSLGHPKPFSVNYIEIGNEDFAGSAKNTYGYRWKDFVTKLSAEFPHLNFIATTTPFRPVLDPTPKYYDNHFYSTPDRFVQNAFSYDSVARNGTFYFEGEYASITTNARKIFGSEGRFTYPTLQSAVSEAAYMTGLERNSDIVFASCYAPVLGKVDNFQWTPNLIAFDAGTIYLSTSYYVQQLFSQNRGTQYLPSTLPDKNGVLHWSVTRDKTTFYIKVVNYGATQAPVTFALPNDVVKQGQVTVITGASTASNNPTTPNVVLPRTSTMTFAKNFDYAAPPLSVSALKVNLK